MEFYFQIVICVQWIWAEKNSKRREYVRPLMTQTTFKYMQI